MDMNFGELHSRMDLYLRRRLRASLPLVLQGMRSVYGGFIGEKLSLNSPAAVWEALRKRGVTQIIDLRYDYRSERFEARCKEHGISYFNYPIHNDPETIASMVENYSQFTELLCAGDFYMMGRSTSYVALCLYWALSKCPGLYPFDLRWEIKRNRQLMKRVAPLLYAMNKYGEQRYGNEPYLPTDYYERQRAQIRDFIENDGPKKVSYSVFDFTRAFRNETVVYDVSVQGIGTVGYLYPPKWEDGEWEYDIVLPPPASGKADSFEDAQMDIVGHLCAILPGSDRWESLPQSVKACISILRVSPGG